MVNAKEVLQALKDAEEVVPNSSVLYEFYNIRKEDNSWIDLFYNAISLEMDYDKRDESIIFAEYFRGVYSALDIISGNVCTFVKNATSIDIDWQERFNGFGYEYKRNHRYDSNVYLNSLDDSY